MQNYIDKRTRTQTCNLQSRINHLRSEKEMWTFTWLAMSYQIGN